MQYVCVVINRMIRWVENVARIGGGGKKNAHTDLVGKSEEASCKT
jgi:hypothetical protein